MGTCCSQGIFSDEALEKGDSQQWGEAEIQQQLLPGSWQWQAFQGERAGEAGERIQSLQHMQIYSALQHSAGGWMEKRQILLVMNSKVLNTMGLLCHNCRAEKGERETCSYCLHCSHWDKCFHYRVKIATTTTWVNIFTFAITFQGRE